MYWILKIKINVRFFLKFAKNKFLFIDICNLNKYNINKGGAFYGTSNIQRKNGRKPQNAV